MPSASARTVKYYRDQGFMCATVEKWIPRIKRRIDLFNVFDQIMVRPGQTWGIQSCVGQGDVAKHITKMLSVPDFHRWIEYGNHAAICSWAVRGAAGKRKMWTCKELIYNPKTKEFSLNVPNQDSQGINQQQVPYFP